MDGFTAVRENARVLDAPGTTPSLVFTARPYIIRALFTAEDP
jgi:hypothetical protein